MRLLLFDLANPPHSTVVPGPIPNLDIQYSAALNQRESGPKLGLSKSRDDRGSGTSLSGGESSLAR
ncbi:MAG: hypothetical protein JO356_20730 [Acidobacteria bacterium]|nr:hypothetical protein [Acidobacteriota bacterium]